MDQIAPNIKSFGHKVLLTYGKGSIKKNGIYDKVVQQLTGLRLRIFWN